MYVAGGAVALERKGTTSGTMRIEYSTYPREFQGTGAGLVSEAGNAKRDKA